jgi:hypothetical protein
MSTLSEEMHPYLQPTAYGVIEKGEWDIWRCVGVRVTKREGGYGGTEMGESMRMRGWV